MNEGFIDEGRIYYRTNDIRSERQSILFIHGLSGSSSAWVDFEEKLGSSYNVYSFDLRGHGKSWKPAGYKEYDMALLAEDIDLVIKQLGITKPILVSHSFATLVVLEYLRRHQDDVLAAVLLSPSANAYDRLVSKLLRPLLVISRHLDLFKAVSRRGSHIDYKTHPQTGDLDFGATMKDIRNTSMRVYLYCTEQSLHADYTDLLGKIRIPVLLVQGRKDTIFPVENSIQMAQKIHGARLKIIEGADHIIVKNNAPEVIADIISFIESLEPTESTN